EFSKGFRKMTTLDVGKRVLREEINIARIEPLGFVEIIVAPIPLTPPACYIGEQFRNPATIRQKATGLLKVIHSGSVIFETSIVVISFGQQRLAEIGLKSESGVSCLLRLFTKGDCWLKLQ